MNRISRTLSTLALSAGLLPAGVFAADKPATKPATKPASAKVADAVGAAAEKLYDRVTPAFVAVKYTWDFELRRQELIGPGVVVAEDGLIMVPLGVVNPFIPDAQMKDFKIIIPSQEKDADEIEAIFVGRDERTNTAFLRPAPPKSETKPEKKPDADPNEGKKSEVREKANQDSIPADGDKNGSEKPAKKKPVEEKVLAAGETPKADKPEAAEKPKSESKPAIPRKWTAVKFEDKPIKVGQRVWSIGVLPEGASYKTYLFEARVSTLLRGEFPQVLVSGGLTGSGSVVFDDDGKAIGYVPGQQGAPVFLNNDGQNSMAAINNPPKIFTPASDLLQSLKDPPIAGKPMDLPWIGVPNMTGLTKDVAEVYGLTNQPAAQIGEVIPDSPAAKAGLKKGDILVKVNGEALDRGDEADEVPIILRRRLIRLKSGSDVTLSVVRKPNMPPVDLKVTLEPAPKQQNLAKRFYAEDLGFGVRELVFNDTYARKLPADAKGVIVSLIRPQSSAQTGGLQGNTGPRSDVITSLNGQPVTDLDSFQTLYKAARKEKAKEAVVLVVRREGREDTVRIEPPQ